jgi:endonuclease
MNKRTKPEVWQLVKESVHALGGKATNAAIRDWILEYYPDTNVNKIQSQIVVCTVNNNARVHYPENQTPREADGPLDFLFRTGPGHVAMYDPREHGVWEIARDKHGLLMVRKTEYDRRRGADERFVDSRFVEETHLIAYLTKNLDVVEEGLEIYVDEAGNDGIGFETEIGAIDILSIDKEGGFVVVTLRNEISTNAATGQILGYTNWVKRHLAQGRPVRGYLIGPSIPDHVRYALAQTDHIKLKEYELSISLKDIPRI